METNLDVQGEAGDNATATVPPDVYQRVLEIVAETLGIQKDQIVPDTVLAEHGDSLDGVDITMEIEDEFELRIPDEDAQGLLTVGQIAQYVAARRAGTGSPSSIMKVQTISGESGQFPL